MKRIDLFEFTDLSWYPQVFRRIQTDYLQFAASRGAGHQNLLPLLMKAMQHAHTTEIVDLCSGGTGPWVRLQEHFKQAGWVVTIKLTDKFPLPQALDKWSSEEVDGIAYLAEPVDALHVPDYLPGMRTIFEGFHHFQPPRARAILQDACENKAAIGIFEASLKPALAPLLLLLAPLMTLLGYLFVTPFIKPRTLVRFFWTYLIPIVPLATCWDGVVSLLRVYSPQELNELTTQIHCDEYIWEIGQASTGTPLFVFTYLIGYPTQTLT